MGAHAVYGGSTINQTMECPAWVEFCKTFPPKAESKYADRGTLLHNEMEIIYTHDADLDPRSVIGSKYKGIVLTEDLYEEKIVPAMAALETIFDMYDVQENDFLCEARVEIDPEIWGTADILARGTLEIPDLDDPGGWSTLKVGICLDYKFGDGIVVKAENNRQGLFYAVAAAVTPETAEFFADIDLLVIGIIQPNSRGEADYSLWPCDPGLLESFKAEIFEAVTNSQRPNPEFKAGDHCKTSFCTARGLCPATSGEISALNRLDVTAPDLLKTFPHYDQVKRAEDIIKNILSLAHSQIEEGVDLTDKGYKVVPKRATRSYIDETEVRARIKKSRKIKREEAYTDKLKSPTQMEKVFKKKGLDFDGILGDQIQKVSTGTTLVGTDDKRKALPGAAALRAALARD